MFKVYRYFARVCPLDGGRLLAIVGVLSLLASACSQGGSGSTAAAAGASAEAGRSGGARGAGGAPIAVMTATVRRISDPERAHCSLLRLGCGPVSGSSEAAPLLPRRQSSRV